MILGWIIACCFLCIDADVFQTGYEINRDRIIFSYPSSDPNLQVFVSGNFNKWTKDDRGWKMKFDPVNKFYRFEKPIDKLKTPTRNFYEFTFCVDSELVDADSSGSNVIFCSGYGYRYVIKW